MKTNKLHAVAAAVILAGIGASVFALPIHNSPAKPAAAAASVPLAGDYVEARTASVFAGACHFNGEYMCLGRDAILAWNFTAGTYNGVSLAGVRAAAVVTSAYNLADPAYPHSSEITVDGTADQTAAVVALLHSKAGDQLGQIQNIHRAPISFVHGDKGYEISAPGFASLSVQYMPDDSCCTQPGNVWYTPLSPITGRKVGYTASAEYSGAISYPWYRSAENSAFYGPIAF